MSSQKTVDKLVQVSKTDLVAAKSAIGIGTPLFTRRNDASFVMLVFYCVNSAHLLFIRLNYGGLDEGASARRFRVCGSSNLVQLAANRDWNLLGGDLAKSYSEVIMPNSIRIFDFSSEPVRIVLIDNQPWFVAVDVCKILRLGNTSQAMRYLDEDEVTLISSEGSHRRMNTVNESGLYALIFKSRKPIAKQFRKWVTNEVLPQIRKTGAYIPNRSIETITPEQYQSLRYIVWGIGNRFQKSNAAEFAAWRALRQYAGVNRVQLIPNDKLNHCIAFLQRLQASLEPFKEAVSKAETRLFQRNFVLSDQDIRRIEQEANNGE
ncbi:hypothetical protein TUMSATVNIG1_17950 [Vibrio nigripulchritudo]|uniref:BRO-N domain-containing protein n=1 Tax=Vibrio nigripulchritudo TaxID=28173 RepID=UPI00190C0FD4|nr:Bro-N domain-containing protein [Vibrio nigripulchritudo]BCL69840.1 hypothetical protein VNTUMSATTG_17770 [Vibrio nigripulchritudo]BDU31186.1 hypothetical protein TUMSATVNIG1_17950 [Vibrio nigripulchritudo]